VAYFLSHINNLGESVPIVYPFPDENIFSIFTKTPWFSNIADYLATRKLPSHISPKEKKKIIKSRAKYPWIKGDILYFQN